MQNKQVTVFGGDGFLGRYVVQELARQGASVRVAVRHPEKATFLRSRGLVGQITPVYANIMDPATTSVACMGADYVINLVGILYESGRQTFEKVHVQGAANVAEAAARHGCKRLIHISSIGADPNAQSKYASSKGKGEAAAHAHFEDVTIVRPSIIFGAEDNFINLFAEMGKVSPIVPVFGGGQNKLQPVYVADLAKAIVLILERPDTKRCTFELGGPQIYPFREILKLIQTYTNRSFKIVSLPFWMGTAIGLVGQFFPRPPLTPDQVKLLKQDNVVGKKKVKTFSDLEMEPQSLEVIIPIYLERFKPIL